MDKIKPKMKMPIIYYEQNEEGEETNLIPYIEVQKEEDFPPVLFISEYRHTGEFEPDEEGNPAPIVDMYLHMFADTEILKEKLDPQTFDKVRKALGLKPLQQASEEGQEVLDNIQKNINKRVN